MLRARLCDFVRSAAMLPARLVASLDTRASSEPRGSAGSAAAILPRVLCIGLGVGQSGHESGGAQHATLPPAAGAQLQYTYRGARVCVRARASGGAGERRDVDTRRRAAN